MSDNKTEDHLPLLNEDDRGRLDQFWKSVMGPGNYSISPQNRMDAWVAEQRMLEDRRANDRMTRATWALFYATAGMGIATVCYTIVTVLNYLQSHA